MPLEHLLPFEGKGAIPFWVRNKRRSFLPVSSSYSIQVPDDKAVSHRELTYQLLAPFEPASQTVHKAEFSLFYSDHGNVG